MDEYIKREAFLKWAREFYPNDKVFASAIGDKGRCYGWHISDLRIYDTPRELSEFQRAIDPCVFCMERIARECTDCKKWGGNIKRPPQSWCYVEAIKDE